MFELLDQSVAGIGEARAAVILALEECGESTLAKLVLNKTMSECWDDSLKVWNEASNLYRPVLFANTWMAALIQNIRPKEKTKSGDALSLIGRLLYTTGPGSDPGLDGLVPLAVWYEGTLSYISSGGPGSVALFEAVKKAINPDGTVPHYNDTLNSMGGIWAVDWSSLDGTSWLYFVAAGTSPFSPVR